MGIIALSVVTSLMMNYIQTQKRLVMDELYKLQEMILRKFKAFGVRDEYATEIKDMFEGILAEKKAEIDETMREGIF